MAKFNRLLGSFVACAAMLGGISTQASADVYKRQTLSQEHLSDSLGRREGRDYAEGGGELYNRYPAGIIPSDSVSYTHLDVYKRQDIRTSESVESRYIDNQT